MADNSKKRFKKIKSNKIWSSILLFVFFLILSAGIMISAVISFARYILDSKVVSEYITVNYMAGVFDNADDNDSEELYSLLDSFNYDYILTDKAGTVIHSKGENTCSSEGDRIKISQFPDEIQVYRDSEIGYIYPDGSGNLDVDLIGFTKWFNENNDDKFSDENIDIIQENDELISQEDMISLPLWISKNVNNGNNTLTVKTMLNSNARDIVVLLEVAGAIALLIATILIVMLVKMITSVIRQRRLFSMFYTDSVTGGNNWMWYLYKGEKLLSQRKNAGNDYAMINLVFVNYRNYCICHSLSEGENMLCRVFHSVNISTDKTDICAHTGSADFALLVRYNDETELEGRIRALLNGLENIDEGHKFCFQAGVTLIKPVFGDKGKPVRRKNINIKEEYNKACMARGTLADSLESGVAYFDDRLVEEQRWVDIVTENQKKALVNEEYVVYYQPKYDPTTNTLKGAEALIRWISPEHGFISPGRFIPIFEKNGFITEIDHYMITHVARDQKRWLDEGLNCVPVSVNVSRAHFIESGLAEQIRDMVDAEGVPHNLIEIELTESAFFDDKNAMINTINRLKSYGFSVSMDDFGSGYSSLNSLKDMPLDVLKLDAEFFRGSNNDNRGDIIVSEAIRLAKSLNMRTVAEGVEIKEQVDFLASEGCDMIQGFYFAKPMPKEEFEERMAG